MNVSTVVSLLGVMDIAVGACVDRYDAKSEILINVNLSYCDNGVHNIGA